MSLIGRKIKHKFFERDSNSFIWYSGTIVGYLEQDKTHCINYEGDSENWNFHLALGLILEDLIIM